MVETEFVKVMQLNRTKGMWDNIIQSYEDHTKVKSVKHQTFRIQYETLKMHDDESIEAFFLRVDEVVNFMRNLAEEIKDASIIENISRCLTPKFLSKVSTIKEMEDLKSLTLDQLRGILTAFEMEKGGPSDMREATFKATTKGKEKEELGYVSQEEEENFIKKLQVGTRRFRGKLPFKCFACGRVGHYVAKCPYKENKEKGKEDPKINRKRFENKRSFYTHEDNNGISNGEEGVSDQDCHLFMEF